MKAFVRSRATATLCLLAVACLGLACSRRPTVRPLRPDSVVLAFGDSLTAGTGAEEGKPYPAVLAQILGCRVINAGQPGELAGAGADRLPALLQAYHPDLVVLCHGGNDMLQGDEAATTAENLRRMVRDARGADADIVMVAVPAPSLSLAPPRFYTEVARELTVPIDTRTLREIIGKPALRSDHVHPNAAGYRILAEAVAALIRRSEP